MVTSTSRLPSIELEDASPDFCRSFACVVAWANIAMQMKPHASTRDIFRSSRIKPGPARFEADGAVTLYGPRDDMRREVWRVVGEREQLLESFGVTLPRHDSAFRLLQESGGALVAYLPHHNLCDGAAPANSDDFFDVNNVPPWDLWIDLVRPPSAATHSDHVEAAVLVSWVPDAFVSFAHDGIDVNPEECILVASLPGSG